jgi:hypothetical protein
MAPSHGRGTEHALAGVAQRGIQRRFVFRRCSLWERRITEIMFDPVTETKASGTVLRMR